MSEPTAGSNGNGRRFGDPSENVLDLVAAEGRRQDDLREAHKVLMEAQVEHLRQTDALRSKFADQIVTIRAEFTHEMRVEDTRRLDEQVRLRAEFTDKLLRAESDRINAIRVVDVNAVSVASQKASDQANVLAAQVNQSANTLRDLVASTAATAATSLQQLVGALSTRITTLEQAGYTLQGKSSYTDPALLELLSEMKHSREDARQTSGKGEGIRLTVGMFIASGAVIVSLIGMLGYSISSGIHRDAPATAPQVIYAPAPTVAQPNAR
jgi:hypothetical protein